MEILTSRPVSFYAVANNLHRSLVPTVNDLLKWRRISRFAFGGVTAHAYPAILNIRTFV